MMKRKAVKVLVISLLCSLGAFAQDKSEWTLQECIDYAMENNLDVKRSVLSVESQDINYSQSKFSRLPNVSANGSYGYSWGRSIDPTTNLFVDNQRIASANANVSGSVVLFNGMRVNNSIKQSRLSFESSQMDLEASKNSVILNIITFYTNVLFARELLENARTQLSSTEQQVELTSKQVEVGALPKSNLLDLQAQKATNELNVVNRENDYLMAKIQLKQVLQLSPDSEIEIVVPELDIESEPVMELSAIEIYNIALNSMPEVQGAQLNSQSAEIGVSVARGDLYPTFSLQGGLTTRYSDASQLPTSQSPVFIANPVSPNSGDVQLYQSVTFLNGNDLQTVNIPATTSSGYETIDFQTQVDDNLSKFVSFNVSIPIFNGFSARSGVQRAIITREQAQINEKDVKYKLWTSIEQSYNDVTAAIKSYNASLKQVQAREESFRVMKQRYDIGAVNFTDYQIAENDLFQAKSDLLRAKYDYIFKLKILDFYQGKPLDF
ncbi:TolC family protein [Fulvivirga sp. 29W222]|uniref:TolC family protein n=1 Tax=Fulvivirga marina TaxID=2494733 RepID=A0A937G2E1_9BACT|nr:TolC family protein [Fulvivirga marina]MBL6448971.1 TolC family protein [Fulvivirga marina]